MSDMDYLQYFQKVVWKEKADSRGLDLPLIDSSYKMPFIICAYLFIVLILGPRFMKNRQPYKLERFMKVYNIVQILANAWIIIDYLDEMYYSNLFCPLTLDFSNDLVPLTLVKHFYYFFLLKIFDYIETIVFILRKKDKQVSGLHLYHHVTTSLIAWLGVRYYPVAPVAINTMLNCFIHVLMYTYYFLATYGPKMQKYIAPMKRWLTILQMVQFWTIIVYTGQNYIPGCRVVPNLVILIFHLNVLMNFYLFYNFYQTAYGKKSKRKTQ